MSDTNCNAAEQPREIINRAEAKIRGLNRYFTGKSCPHGHIAERTTRNGGCIECKRERAMNFRSANPELARERNRRWRLENPDRARECDIRSNAKNIDKSRAITKRWRAENTQRLIEYYRKYRAEKHEYIRQSKANFRSTPHGRAEARKEKEARRARKLQAVPPWFGELDDLVMQEAAHLAVLREAATGIAWHVDHMIPLAARTACGLHCAANLQVIPAIVNQSKHNKLVLTEPGEWIRHL